MGVPLYVGIENEYQLWLGPIPLDATPRLKKAISKSPECFFMPRYKAALRTSHGNGIYSDVSEAEFCTAPVRVEKGFSTQVANSLRRGRQDIALQLRRSGTIASTTGYSMHTNLSRWNGGLLFDYVLQCLGVPTALMILNPYSQRIKLRSKENRYELVSDYLQNEEQVAAATLLYVAGMIALQRKRHMPLSVSRSSISIELDERVLHNPVVNGRNTKVEVFENHEETELTAQEYLERHYFAIKDVVGEIATTAEISQLEEFITGKRPLEGEDKRKYGYIPLWKNPESRLSKFIVDRQRTVDLEQYLITETRDAGRVAAFLGRLVAQRDNGYTIQSLEWKNILLSVDAEKQQRTITIGSLPLMDVYAQLTAKIPDEKFVESLIYIDSFLSSMAAAHPRIFYNFKPTSIPLLEKVIQPALEKGLFALAPIKERCDKRLDLRYKRLASRVTIHQKALAMLNRDGLHFEA